jgi:hypothetical protein
MNKQDVAKAIVDRELDAHLRLLFNQARSILEPTFKSDDYAVENFSDCVTAMISAMAEIRKTSRAEEKRLAAIENCDYVDFFVEFDHVVASAVASLIEPVLKPDDWSPYSAGAAPYIVFAKAYTASRLASVLGLEVSEWESAGNPEIALKAMDRKARDR